MTVWSPFHGLVVVNDDGVLNSHRQLIYISIEGKSRFITSLVIFDK